MKKAYKNFLFKAFVPVFATLSGLAANAQTIYAVNDANQLGSFSAMSPSSGPTMAITGLVAGQNVVGIDFRPHTGELYALGYNSADSSANLYTIDKTTAAATKIGASALKLVLGNGSKVGFDFNPTVDRIRVVAGTDANYRLHPVTGAIAFTDGRLKYSATDIHVGKNPNVAASAYTNSFIGAGSTVLYNFDDSLNIITSQNPPNDGVLNTVGGTGITWGINTPLSGFDIYKDPVSLANIAFLSLSTSSSMSSIYTLDLATGLATMRGQIAAVKDIAVEIDRTLPANTNGKLVYGIQGAANLVSFDSENPKTIRSWVSITGVTAGQTIVGMDFRPKTKELYLLGYNAANGQSQIYTLEPVRGVATPIASTPIVLNLGANAGMDFNPVVDRIRVVGTNNANYRLHPVTGAIAFTDTALAFGMGDVNLGKNPFISSIGYTNSYDGTTTTSLVGFDDSLNVFVVQSPPNRGTLTTNGTAPFQVNLLEPSSDLDIYYNSTSASNSAFMVANTGTSTNDSLYVVDFMTGAVTNKGLIGLGVAVRDIAVTIDASTVTGLFDFNATEKSMGLNLFPNPLTDEATLDFVLSQSSQVEVNVLNMMGERVATLGSKAFPSGAHSYRISTENLPNGTYLFELKVNGVRQSTLKGLK